MNIVKRIFCIILLGMFAQTLSAQETAKLEVPEIYGMPGSETTLAVHLKNTSLITAFQFTLELPVEFSVDLSSLTLSDRKDDHVVTGKPLGEGKYLFVGYSAGNKALRGNSGKLLTINLTIPESCVEGGKYAVEVIEPYLCLSDGNNVADESTNGYINILKSPDLYVSDVWCDLSSAHPGDSIVVTWNVGNAGGSLAEDGWNEYVFLQSENGETDKLLGKTNSDIGLESGLVVDRSAGFVIPKVLGVDGKCKLYVKLVPFSTTGEKPGNDGNNIAYSNSEFYVDKNVYLDLGCSELSESDTSSIRCMIVRSGNWNTDEQFKITTDSKRLDIPSTLIIAKGQSAAYFNVGVIDNKIMDSSDIVNIRLSSDGYNAIERYVLVRDDERPALRVEINGSEYHEGDTIKMVVRSNVVASKDLSVKLLCDNKTRVKVPSYVTIAAGCDSVSVDAIVLNDNTPSLTITPSIRAYADNYETGERLVIVYDDDMPEFELSFMPATVSESAGAMASVATVRRTKGLNSKAVLKLKDNSNGRIYYQENSLTFKPGVEVMQFSVGVVDDDIIDGDKEYIVSGSIYMSDCDCSIDIASNTLCTSSLTVVDDDAPSLYFSYISNVISEGGAGTAITVGRNFASEKELVVALSSNSSRLVFDRSVVIPAGENSVTFKVAAELNDQTDDTELVSLSARADGLADANCWVVINNGTLADAKIKLAVYNDVFLAGKECNALVTIYNDGNIVLPQNVPFKISFSGNENEKIYITESPVYPKDSLVISIDDLVLPGKIGSNKVQAVVNFNASCPELLYVNNSSNVCNINIESPFSATINAEKDAYEQESIVNMSGKLSGDFVADTEIEVYLINNDLRLGIPVTVDADGNYSLEYKLPHRIIGVVGIGACFPGEESRAMMDTFTVTGLYVDRPNVDCSMQIDEIFKGKFVIYNPCDKALTNVCVSQDKGSDNCTFSFDYPQRIEPKDSVTVEFKITPNTVTEGLDWSEMPLTITADGGAFDNCMIYYYVESINGKLYSTVTSINTTLSIETPREFHFWIYNIGKGETGKITFALPSFMETVTPTEIPSLLPSDSALVVLRFNPTDRMSINVPVKGRLGINCMSGDGIPISYEVTPVSDNEAVLSVDVVDENTFYAEGNPHVKNAYVKLMDLLTGDLLFEGYTDENGLFQIKATEGYYQLKVSAENHRTYSAKVLLNPGVENNMEVFLPYNAISYSWSVVETEVQDEYVIETVMKYDIRVPKAIVEIILPDERPKPYSVFPVRVVNRGLLAATDVELELSIKNEKGLEFPVEFLNKPFVDKLMPSHSETFYARVAYPLEKELMSVSKVAPASNAFNNNDARCLYIISKALYQQLCKQYKDEASFSQALKKFSSDSICPNRPQDYDLDTNVGGEHRGPGGRCYNCFGSGKRYNDGSIEDNFIVDPDNPRQYCEDWIGAKLVALNGKSEGKEVKGVAADGVSKVKIVLDEQELALKFEYSKYSPRWSLSESIGTLEIGDDLFEDVTYTAPVDFPQTNKFSHKIKAVLRTSKDNYSKDLAAVEIEIVRPPLLLLHGLMGSSDTWSKLKNFLVTEHKMYMDFAVCNLGYRTSNNQSFYVNVEKVRNMANHLFNVYSKNKYVANKLDIIGHSMGGVLARLYTQEGSEDKVHKLITVNTPHAGSEIADIILAHRSLVGHLVKLLHDNVINESVPFSWGAITDLAVESQAISELNSNHTRPDVPVHAIATHVLDNIDPNLINEYWKMLSVNSNSNLLATILGILHRISVHFMDDMGKYHPISDLVVNIESQLGNDVVQGGSGYTVLENIMHMGSTNADDVINKLVQLLRAGTDSEEFNKNWFNPKERTFDSSGCENLFGDIMLHQLETLYQRSSGKIIIKTKPEKRIKNVVTVVSSRGVVEILESNNAEMQKAQTVDGSEVSEVFAFDVPPYFSGNVSTMFFFIDDSDNLCYDVFEFNVDNPLVVPQKILADSVYYVSEADSIDINVKCVYSDGIARSVIPNKIVFTTPVASYADGVVYGLSAGSSRSIIYYEGLYVESEFHVVGDSISDDVDDDADEEESSNICSEIKLSVEQEAVVTRQAFRGTFVLNNGNDVSSIDEFCLNLRITDEDGVVATDKEFVAEIESLDGFVGSKELGALWSLDAGCDGKVVILFVPTKYAAPLEKKKYAFGGSISYMDPFSGAKVTREMNDVYLDVSPSPELELMYFLQRDVLGDDPLTSVVESMQPAEFALVVNNKGQADAKDLKIATGQPQIRSNEKGVLVNFEIVSASLNGEEKSLSIDGASNIDFGSIAKNSQSYAQWWLQCSLLGHFVEYDVNVTRVSTLDNPNLSLIDTATIHELIHGFEYVKVPDKHVRAFLVNDIEDIRDLPDYIYFSDATSESVTLAQNAVVEKVNELEYKLTVEPSYKGWNYGYIVDPTVGLQDLYSVQCDVDTISCEQMWQTDRTLRDGKDPIYENLLHFADYFEGGKKCYTLRFSKRPDVQLAIDTIYGKSDLMDLQSAPLDYLYVQFNKPIDDMTFTSEDISLTCQGITVNVEDVVIVGLSENLYQIDLTRVKQPNGFYSLTVQTADITDVEGYRGKVGYNLAWNMISDGELDYMVVVRPEGAGIITPQNGTCQYGDTLELKVEPLPGYEFVGWKKNDVLLSCDSVLRCVVDENLVIYADFVRIDNLVSISYNGSCGVVTGDAAGVYEYGTELTFYAKPKNGCIFREWIVNGVVVEDKSPVLTLSVEEPLHIEASFMSYILGDINGDSNVEERDVGRLLSFLIGVDVPDVAEMLRSDMNGDNMLSIVDIVRMVSLIARSDGGMRYSSRTRNLEISRNNFDIVVGKEALLPVVIERTDCEYYGFQVDVRLPFGMEIKDVLAAEQLNGFNVVYGNLGDNKWRILVFSMQMKSFGDVAKLLDIVLLPVVDIPLEECFVEFDNVRFVDTLFNEEQLEPFSVYFDVATAGIDALRTSFAVKGGDAVYITSQVDTVIEINALDGRTIKYVEITPGVTVVKLPRGVYLVQGKKLVII